MTGFRRAHPSAIPENWAELLVELGRAMRKRMRRGAGIVEACRQLRIHPERCWLALAFDGSSDLLKFRAMVEDWSYERIAEELGRARKVRPADALP